MTRIRQLAGVLFMALLFCSAQHVFGQGDGGVVVVDRAPVYVRSTGDSIGGTMSKTFRVAGVTTHGIAREEYRFESKDGRLHVQYSDSQGALHNAWMRPTDLGRFTYDCSCDKKGCSPWEGGSNRWNKCFTDGASEAIARLMPTPRPISLPAAAVAAKPEQSVKAFSNEDVVALVKAGLDDGIVIAKIEAAPGEGLDLSIEALVKLRKQGVSSRVVQAMVRRAGGGGQAPSQPSAEGGRREPARITGSREPSDQEVGRQVSGCLNGARPLAQLGPFSDHFEIQTIEVRDRMVKGDEVRIVATVTVRLKHDYQVGTDLFSLFERWVSKPGKAGDVVATGLRFVFDKYESGWRLRSC